LAVALGSVEKELGETMLLARGAASLAATMVAMVGVGCAAPVPAQYHRVERSHEFTAPFDEVWTRLMAWFTSNQIQIKTIEKQSGVVYAEKAQVPADWPADCGQPGFEDVVSRPMSMNVYVREEHPGKVTVTVNVQVSERRSFSGKEWTVQCNSTGKLESSVFSALQ
jgi:hypothetical protein